jgi:NAD(P)-dependent dehydrogenase (short-subunit alcohol dehydrogenase family)
VLTERISFDGQVVLVTGAGSLGYDNLGRSYALELASRGARVAVNDINPDGAERVAGEIRDAGGEALAVPGSISSRQGARDIVEAAIDGFGRLDALINNAGTLRKDLIQDMQAEDLDTVHDVHLRGQIYVGQRAYQQMLTQGYGRIVNVSSTAGVFGMVNLTAYATAKASIIGLTNVISLEGREHGILCNAMLPNALVDRPEGPDTGGSAVSDEQKRAGLKAFGPLAGNGAPPFVAPLTVYLASSACTTTHHLYCALNGWYTRVFIGMTRGWTNWTDTPPTVEDIHEHLSEIDDETGYAVPGAIGEVSALLAKIVAERS